MKAKMYEGWKQRKYSGQGTHSFSSLSLLPSPGIYILSFMSLDLAETFFMPFCKGNIICSLFYEFIPLFDSVQFLLMLKPYLSKSLILATMDPILSLFW